MNLLCQDCHQWYKKPAVYKKRKKLHPKNDFYRLVMLYCDKCRKKHQAKETEYTNIILKALMP